MGTCKASSEYSSKWYDKKWYSDASDTTRCACYKCGINKYIYIYTVYDNIYVPVICMYKCIYTQIF